MNTLSIKHKIIAFAITKTGAVVTYVTGLAVAALFTYVSSKYPVVLNSIMSIAALVFPGVQVTPAVVTALLSGVLIAWANGWLNKIQSEGVASVQTSFNAALGTNLKVDGVIGNKTQAVATSLALAPNSLQPQSVSDLAANVASAAAVVADAVETPPASK